MKKHQIIAAVGTLALAVNLIAPGLALGQSNQFLNAQVNCNAGAPATTFGDVPGDVTFRNPQNSAGSYAIVAGQNTDAIDTNVTDTAGAVPNTNILEVIMGNSGGADGCPLANAGFVVTAASTNLVSGSNNIPAGNIKMVTTSNVAGVGSVFQTTRTHYNSPALTADGNVLYSDAAGLGNAHDVTAPLAVSTSADLSGTTGGDTNGSIATHYDNSSLLNPGTDNFYNAFQNSSSAAQQLTVLGSCTGHGVAAAAARTGDLTQYQTAIAAGVAVTVHVPDSQPTGNYTGTITYTENSQNCPIQLGTLSAQASASDATLSTSSLAHSVQSGTMLLVDNEWMKATATALTGATSISVARAQAGTLAAQHASGAAIYVAGYLNPADPTASVAAADTGFTASVDDFYPYHIGDILVAADNGDRVTVVGVSGTSITTTAFATAHASGTGIIDTQDHHVS